MIREDALFVEFPCLKPTRNHKNHPSARACKGHSLMFSKTVGFFPGALTCISMPRKKTPDNEKDRRLEKPHIKKRDNQDVGA